MIIWSPFFMWCFGLTQYHGTQYLSFIRAHGRGDLQGQLLTRRLCERRSENKLPREGHYGWMAAPAPPLVMHVMGHCSAGSGWNRTSQWGGRVYFFLHKLAQNLCFGARWETLIKISVKAPMKSTRVSNFYLLLSGPRVLISALNTKLKLLKTEVLEVEMGQRDTRWVPGHFLGGNEEKNGMLGRGRHGWRWEYCGWPPSNSTALTPVPHTAWPGPSASLGRAGRGWQALAVLVLLGITPSHEERGAMLGLEVESSCSDFALNRGVPAHIPTYGLTPWFPGGLSTTCNLISTKINCLPCCVPMQALAFCISCTGDEGQKGNNRDLCLVPAELSRVMNSSAPRGRVLKFILYC